jgi:serine/threonine protein kinase
MSVNTKPTTTTGAQATIRIGSYDLLGTLGHGNFSVCKLAQNKLTNHMVAIKCVEKRNLDATHLTRLYREIEIMKQMDHTNIIKLNQVNLFRCLNKI